MKNHIHLAVVRLLSATLCSITISSGAAVPVRWTAETSRVQPIALDAWRGDTLALECTLKSYGQPVALGAATASLMWQTNGMGATWWQTNATVSSDGVIRATWSPSMDPGAPAVAFFLPVQTADGASYRAAGTLRFRPSPGAGSQIADLPQPGGTLDFGEFNLVNAPWATLAAANEAISAAVTSATGALVIPPAVDLSPYATTGALQTASTSLSNDIQLAFNASSNYTDQVASGLSSSITSATNSLGSVLRDNIAESAAATHSYADSVASNAQAYADGVASNAQANAIAAIPSLAGYATETYVESAISAITIPSVAGYATTAYADAAASNAQAAAIAAIPSLSGYATQSFVADYFATNYTPPDLSSYASRSYADAAASNAQAAAIAAIPSLAGYATETYVDSAISAISIPSLAGYATTAYADAAASNAQAAAIAAIPSLAGYSTETYAQNAAESAASDALSAAQSYARDLSWGASVGNTRLVSLDGLTWQDATGTVWQVSYIYGWSGTVIDLQTSAARPIAFYYAGTTTTAPTTTSPTDYWTAGGGTNLYFDSHTALSWELWMANDYHGMINGYWQPLGTPTPPSTATNLSFNTAYELYTLFYQPVALATNPVDHVLYEQSPVLRDIIAELSSVDATNAAQAVISDFASTGAVHAAETSTYASRLFDASFDSAYDATYLIRESTNAATAVSSSIVRYALVTPGEWSFSGSGVESGVTYTIEEYEVDGTWYYDLNGNGEPYLVTTTSSQRLLTVDFWNDGDGYHITATRPSLPGHLLDRAVNAVSISTPTNITLPALSHPGQARDFILLLDIPSSVTDTVPGLTGLLTFTPSGSETVHYYVDGDDPSSAEFPVPTSPSTWSYSFSEFKASWFAISLKQIVEAVPPSQGGAQ